MQQTYLILFLTRHSDVDILNSLYFLAGKILNIDYSFIKGSFILQLKKDIPRVSKEVDRDQNLYRINSSITLKLGYRT